MRGDQHGDNKSHDQPGHCAHSPQGPGITEQDSDKSANRNASHDRHDHNEIRCAPDMTLLFGVGSGHRNRLGPRRGGNIVKKLGLVRHQSMSRGTMHKPQGPTGSDAGATLDGMSAEPVGSSQRLRNVLSRLGSGGVLEAIIALSIFVFAEVNYGPPGLTWVQFLADAFLAFFAGASGRWPVIGGIGAGLGLTVVAFSHGYSLSLAIFCMFVPVVSTGAHGLGRLRDILSIWYLATILTATTTTAPTAGEAIQSALIFGALMAGAWATGRTIGRLREERGAERQRQVDALRAQRRTIARDLHDTVAYSTTTMIMRAEQIKLSVTDDELRDDLDFIINTGRRSVRELRGMLEALRRNDPSFDISNNDGASPWRIVELDDVLETQRAELAAHGLTLAVTRDVDLHDLPGSVREAVAKLVVEATSNMVKHAAPGPCQVLLDRHDNTLEVVFTNRLRRTTKKGSESGLGLLGATERVEALGGTLEATRASDTWILSAQLPLGGE